MREPESGAGAGIQSDISPHLPIRETVGYQTRIFALRSLRSEYQRAKSTDGF